MVASLRGRYRHTKELLPEVAGLRQDQGEVSIPKSIAMTSDDRFQHHYSTINGLSYHFVSCGAGPAVLFCHGFPDLWRSWRAQMLALAARGYRAIAPDLRGFGESQGPQESTSYTATDVVGDLIGILDHLEIETATIVGHDWGASIAWTAALIRPDRFVGVAAVSVPYTPRGPESMVEMLRKAAPPDLYMLYFLEPGPADAELDGEPETFLRRLFYSNSGALPGGRVPSMRLSSNGRLIEALESTPEPMPWFDDSEIEIYTTAFRRTGFTPALNTYRSLHRSWELLGAWADRTVQVPALYIGGERDIVRFFPGMQDVIDQFMQLVPRARPATIVSGAGHFVHMEKPDQVNRLLLDFLAETQPSGNTMPA